MYEPPLESQALEQRPEPAKPYSVKRALLGIFLLPAIFIAVTVGVSWLLRNSGQEFDPIVGFALSSSTFLIAALIYLATTGKFRSAWSFLKLDKFRWWYIPVGLGGAVATYMVSILLGMIAVAIQLAEAQNSGNPSPDFGENSTSQTIGALSEIHSIFFIGFFIAILAPIAEEIFFRGALLGSIVQDSTKSWLQILAVAIVSVIFGFAHFQGSLTTFADLLAMVTPGLVGVTAAILTLSFKSLYPAIFTHMIYNGGVLLVITLAGS